MTKAKIQTIVKRSSLHLLRALALLCISAMLHCGGDLTPAAAPAQNSSLVASLEELSLSPSNPQIARGTGQQFLLRGFYKDGHVRNLTSDSDVRFGVTDEGGHSLPMPPSGYLQLDLPGRYIITATYSGHTLTTPVIVTSAMVKSVAISPSKPSVALGLTQQFTTIATFTDGSKQDVTMLATWAVMDVMGTGVATIDTQGLLHSKSIGQATITTSYMAHSSSTTATVTAAALTLLAVSPASPTIANGTSEQFKATGTFSDGTTMDVTAMATWAVSDMVGKGVAEIDGTGIATGKSVGQALVSADYKGLTAQTTLNVSPALPISVAISPSSTAIPKGTSQRFAAIATLTDGTTQDVTAMAAWTATDLSGTGVASIDSTGLATANALGTSTIGCAYHGDTANAVLTVTPAVIRGLLVSPATLSLYKGQLSKLLATGFYSDGSTQDVTTLVAWTATDLLGTDVASVDAGGQVFAKNLGKSTITASLGGFSANNVLTVNPPTYTGLSISPSTGTAIIGVLPVQYTATAHFPDGSTLDVTAATVWSEKDVLGGTGLATVNGSGLATGLVEGIARIKGTFSGFTASAQLLVF